MKTINFERTRKDWQVDTGIVLLPDLSAPPKDWSAKFQLAHIAFRTPYWADFLVDQPTPPVALPSPLGGEGRVRGKSPLTWHYSQRVNVTARNVLLALEEKTR